jgi:hypothetical protein
VLLHIADGIEAMGPVWTYWAFPMERFCGKLLRCIKSRRHPFANIDSHITAIAQLDQIKNRYNAHEQLALLPQKEGNSREFAFVKCKCLPKSIFTFPDFSTGRSGISPVFSPPKKSGNSEYPSYKNHGSISHSF